MATQISFPTMDHDIPFEAPPKTEFHCHFNGFLHPAAILSLRTEQHIPVLVPAIADIVQISSLLSNVSNFLYPSSILGPPHLSHSAVTLSSSRKNLNITFKLTPISRNHGLGTKGA
jgi:hypothetical protein